MAASSSGLSTTRWDPRRPGIWSKRCGPMNVRALRVFRPAARGLLTFIARRGAQRGRAGRRPTLRACTKGPATREIQWHVSAWLRCTQGGRSAPLQDERGLSSKRPLGCLRGNARRVRLENVCCSPSSMTKETLCPRIASELLITMLAHVHSGTRSFATGLRHGRERYGSCERRPKSTECWCALREARAGISACRRTRRTRERWTRCSSEGCEEWGQVLCCHPLGACPPRCNARGGVTPAR